MIRFCSAAEIATKVKAGELTATAVIEHFLAAVNTLNPQLNAYTQVAEARALEQAAVIDAKVTNGEPVGKLAGVPFAVKNLFDITDVATLAGSKINALKTAATDDAFLVQQLLAQDAVLLGALNMGEFAYDFTGENAHHGNCHNPWQLNTMSGGSSSGSGSATAAGLAPISLGSDTNGSIRVPASLCGIFGLKPTFGRLARTGTYPFVDSLDHLGPLARTTKDLALAFDVLQGISEADHAQADKPLIDTTAELSKGLEGLRIATLGGYFDSEQYPAPHKALMAVANTLQCTARTEIPYTAEGRAAAYLISNIEGSTLHLDHLQNQLAEFDPDTQSRFVAGTVLPAHWYTRAQQVRRFYHDQAMKVFEEYDVLLAPATPCTAPAMGEKWLSIGEDKVMLRPNLGYFTQPFSAIGTPSVVVPAFDEEAQKPIGVQIIAAPWREDICLRVAHYLEQQGFVAKVPTGLPL